MKRDATNNEIEDFFHISNWPKQLLLKNGEGVPIFPIKIGRVGKIGGVVFKSGGYHLFSY